MRGLQFEIGGASLVLALCAMAGPHAAVQHASRTDIAARMSGRWKLNQELSPDLMVPDPGRPGRGGQGMVFAVTGAPQRGGRGGGGSAGGGAAEASSPNLLPGEAAAQAALSAIQQVPLELTIEATETQVRFLEPRGTSVFQIDGRNVSVEVPGGSIKVKSRWDRATLRQEFSTAQRMLRRSWSIDADNRLVLGQRIESMTFNSREARAVFDRQ
ncbi:MAG TPA: hypothetical protein VD833_19680 [Vicinamibacterales bacterium]|nr:hypothetical protein [Vicinamibacterales bacterium]